MTVKIKHPTVKEIEKLTKEGTLKYRHTSWTRRYVSRRGCGYALPYNGRFGRGYVIYRPSWQSTQYSHIDYYIYGNNNTNKHKEAKK